ncbi:hypothetical protein like AT5G58375 [Hibiscus trionum]|uniref:Methyltransferase-related protein n=1 Tax=Hibiscus trionum TaxID=183268 RepID=A0A9W7IKT2_HIBTR|nr:hypothetical protein like AT5G58375 [Hibiscus trionum]
MCPLRLILIFLSATLAGFLLIRNVKSHPQSSHDDDPRTADINRNSHSAFSKVWQVIESGFWTCVDMASGRYLWRHLVSSNSKHST